MRRPDPVVSATISARLTELVGLAVPGHGFDAARESAGGRGAEAGRDWSDGGPALIDAARTFRLTGAMMAAVGAGSIELSQEQIDLLHSHHFGALAWCLRLEDRLCEVVERLTLVGVTDLRVIKGSAIAHLDEADPSHRTFGDLDLLVSGPQFDWAAAALEKMGAHRPYPERRAGWDHRFAKSATLTFDDGVEVDLHRTICDGVHAVRVPLDRLFADPDSFVLAGQQMLAMDRTARALHACYHAVLGSPTPRLMSRRDLAGYLARTNSNVDLLVAEAQHWRGTAVLHEAVGSVLALPGLQAAGVDLSGWSAWWTATDIPAAERAVVAAQRRDGSSFGPSRIRVAWEMPGLRNRAAYLRGLLLPTAEHLASRGVTRSSLVQRVRRRVAS